MLSKEVREGLHAELEYLRIRRKKLTEKIDVRIAAIEAVLRPEEDFLGPQQIPLTEPSGSGSAKAIPPTTFRDAIRNVLAERPGLTAPEVAELLGRVRERLPISGSTPFKVRVSNELMRMYKTGKLTKRAARYSLAPAQAGAA